MPLVNRINSFKRDHSSLKFFSLWGSVDKMAYAIIILHILIWTLLPVLLRSALPMDVMETTVWAQHLTFGYDKNPYLNAWLTWIGLRIGGYHDVVLYLLSQLATGCCFIGVFLLGKRLFSPMLGLMALLLLEGNLYLNYFSIDFDDNLLELGLWSLGTLFFYQAVTSQRIGSWIITGLFAGLALMDKYFAVILFVPAFIFLSINSRARQSFFNRGFYLALVVTLLVCLPHIIWLFKNNFITLRYAIQRVETGPSYFWQEHLWNPIYFVLMQLININIVFLLYLLLFKKSSTPSPSVFRHKIGVFEKQFLLFFALGPIALCFLIGILGFHLYIMWGTPLLIFLPLYLLSLKKTITLAGCGRLVIGTSLFVLFEIVVYTCNFHFLLKESKANFPGKLVGQQVTQRWHEKLDSPFAYVMGAGWIAGVISFYSAEKPRVYVSENFFQIFASDLKKKGAMIVGLNKEGGHAEFMKLVAQFPQAKILPPLEFCWGYSQQKSQVELALLNRED